MSYSVRLYSFEDVSDEEKRQAERRFCKALNEALGDASLVLPVYAVYRKLVALHGDTPSADALSTEELELFTQWQAAESAALTAALGPHRYMGDAEFDIRA
jgi:Cys-tRNA synthase (O-phospho-L-seryl-tRNA:Cys-tRNA synthase)